VRPALKPAHSPLDFPIRSSASAGRFSIVTMSLITLRLLVIGRRSPPLRVGCPASQFTGRRRGPTARRTYGAKAPSSGFPQALSARVCQGDSSAVHSVFTCRRLGSDPYEGGDPAHVPAQSRLFLAQPAGSRRDRSPRTRSQRCWILKLPRPEAVSRRGLELRGRPLPDRHAGWCAQRWA